MNHPRRQLLTMVLTTGLALVPGWAQAHGTRAGDVEVDHPYAAPTVKGAPTGAVYIKTLVNRGQVADRLVSASTPVATSVEFHRSEMDGNIMRMRAMPHIDLLPGVELKTKHGGSIHLMLMGLKAPLKDGDQFTLKLKFERGGEREVDVWVHEIRGASGNQSHQHKH